MYMIQIRYITEYISIVRLVQTRFNTCYMGRIVESNGYTLDLRRESVAAHELGHSLGLAHKGTFSDVMTTYETSYTFPSLNDMRSYAEASLNY